MKRSLLALLLAIGVLLPTTAHAETWESYKASHGFWLRPIVFHPDVLASDALLQMDAWSRALHRGRVRRWRAWVRANRYRIAVPNPGTESGPVDWDAIADCEWDAQSWTQAVTTGNGFYFRLQFSEGTWNANRGELGRISYWVGIDMAPTREQQIVVAKRVEDTQGLGAWPNCQVFA